MTRRPLPPDARLVPHNATLVFKGVIYDTYQWLQKLPDGTTTTFEMLKRPDTVMIIAIDDNGEVVVVDETQPGGIVRSAHLPVGRVDTKDQSVLARQHSVNWPKKRDGVLPTGSWSILCSLRRR